MENTSLFARPLARPDRAFLPLAGLFLALACLALLLLAPPSQAGAVGKGVIDWRLEMPEGISDLSTVPALVSDMGPAKLNATWTRVYFRWARIQPLQPASATDPGYDAAYVNELDAVIGALHAQGTRVILTGTDVPSWAIDGRYRSGAQYVSDVVPRMDDAVVRTAWQNLARFLAARYADKAGKSFPMVGHFEVWNEPNLGSGLNPQLVGKKQTVVGPRAYFLMLKYFSVGAKQGNRSAVVIAGATSRRGANDAHSTSPQWFANYLKRMKASRYFDAYSHHPYTPPGSKPSPSAPPAQPRSMVTLGNISTLLKVFPSTPFYLTEYGYSTGAQDLFCLTVSPADQARYLRQAYALAARYKQVKVILWFLETDYYAPTPEKPRGGIYSGLVDLKGVLKPAWYAFAGRNVITATAPSSVKPGMSFTLAGTLTSKLGARAAQSVILQSRSLSGSTWSKVRATTTDAGGAYSFSVKQSKSRAYRVVWDGVCESKAKKVVSR